jgi:nicotinamidase/pyrazinamidase
VKAKYVFRNKSSIGLELHLNQKSITVIYIAGLAACLLGFNIFGIKDAVRGVDLNPEEIQRAFEEIKNAGAKIVESSFILEN